MLAAVGLRLAPLVIALLVLMGCVPLPPGASAERASEVGFADPERRAELARAFPEIDAMVAAEVREHGLAGMALGVVIDGELAHFSGAGVTSLDTGAPPTPDSVYRIASITKSFTALGILALRDEGALGLDDPIARFIPEASRLVAPTADSPAVTLRHLLTHTGGLPSQGPYAALALPTEEVATRSLPGYPLDLVPGTAFHYSNFGYQLLGVVIHRVSGQPLRAFMAKRIFGPLGMRSTSFDASGLAPGQLALGYTKNERGALVPVPIGPYVAVEGAGGIFSSVRDMTRYLALHLGAYPPRSAPDGGPVRRSSVREAHLSALRGGRFSIQLRADAAAGESLVAARVATYGYGLGVVESCELDQMVTHNGGLPGYSSAIAFLPERGVGIVALASHGPGAVDPTGLAQRALLALRRTGGLAPRVALVPGFPGTSPAAACPVK
jgi:CubicO group peptidase (beta-lactamase class C family)